MRVLLRHFFLPHHTNNHRAKALHPDMMLVYVFLLALFNFGFRYVHTQFPSVLGYATDIRLSQLLDLTNAKREGLGLGKLRLNAKLSEAAAGKARDMFANNYWAHTSPEGKTPWVFINGAGYQYTMAGENLAKNFSDSGGVVEAWMASPTHRANIVKPGYRDVGFAIVNGILEGEETTLVVQMFGASNTEEIVDVPVPLAEGITTETLGDQAAPVADIASQQPAAPFMSTVSSVIRAPLVNIPTMTRDLVFIFLGLMIGILVLDGFVITRSNIVRVAGHNLAHIMFLAAIALALMIVRRGALI